MADRKFYRPSRLFIAMAMIACGLRNALPGKGCQDTLTENIRAEVVTDKKPEEGHPATFHCTTNIEKFQQTNGFNILTYRWQLENHPPNVVPHYNLVHVSKYMPNGTHPLKMVCTVIYYLCKAVYYVHSPPTKANEAKQAKIDRRIPNPSFPSEVVVHTNEKANLACLLPLDMSNNIEWWRKDQASGRYMKISNGLNQKIGILTVMNATSEDEQKIEGEYKCCINSGKVCFSQNLRIIWKPSAPASLAKKGYLKMTWTNPRHRGRCPITMFGIKIFPLNCVKRPGFQCQKCNNIVEKANKMLREKPPSGSDRECNLKDYINSSKQALYSCFKTMTVEVFAIAGNATHRLFSDSKSLTWTNNELRAKKKSWAYAFAQANNSARVVLWMGALSTSCPNCSMKLTFPKSWYTPINFMAKDMFYVHGKSLYVLPLSGTQADCVQTRCRINLIVYRNRATVMKLTVKKATVMKLTVKKTKQALIAVEEISSALGLVAVMKSTEAKKPEEKLRSKLCEEILKPCNAVVMNNFYEIGTFCGTRAGVKAVRPQVLQEVCSPDTEINCMQTTLALMVTSSKRDNFTTLSRCFADKLVQGVNLQYSQRPNDNFDSGLSLTAVNLVTSNRTTAETWTGRSKITAKHSVSSPLADQDFSQA